MANPNGMAALEKQATDNAKAIGELIPLVKGLAERAANTRAADQPDPNSVLGSATAPRARTGEDIMGSRGFSFIKMLGLVTGQVDPNQAKFELDIHNRMHNCLVKDPAQAGYTYGGAGQAGAVGGKFLAPLGVNYLHDQFVDNRFRAEVKSMVRAGVAGADHDEMNWMKRKEVAARYGEKTLSWLNEFTGGSLVAPAEQGEIIELLRNKEALVNAGARTVPLPPQGRLKYPRQTAASLTYWVGESSPITASDIGTGEIVLQAKKLAVLIKTSNELIRFASPAAEALMRDDMTKSLALGLDLAALEGQGGDNRPRGVIQYPNINRVTSSSPTANGDQLVAEDIYRMVAAVEESNAEFEGWIMRPKTWYKYLQLRADAVAQGDRQGMFLFNAIREPGELSKEMLASFPVTKSTQVSQSRSKGTATNLTYILGGMWSEVLIGMFGAIEFAQTAVGDTSFVNDQTWVRGILSADVQIRHEAAIVLMDNLSTTL